MFWLSKTRQRQRVAGVSWMSHPIHLLQWCLVGINKPRKTPTLCAHSHKSTQLPLTWPSCLLSSDFAASDPWLSRQTSLHYPGAYTRPYVILLLDLARDSM